MHYALMSKYIDIETRYVEHVTKNIGFLIQLNLYIHFAF